jgi:hypothetical protein
MLGYALLLFVLLAVPYSITNPEEPVWFKLCAMRPVQRNLLWGAILCIGAGLVGTVELFRLGRARIPAGKLLGIVIPVAVTLHFAIALGEFWPINRPFERAATALANGQSPYSTAGYSAAPPVLQATAFVQQALRFRGGDELSEERLALVSNSLNVLFLMLAAMAILQLGRYLRVPDGHAGGITLALIVCNAPLNNQLVLGTGGLWLFGFVCLACAALPRHAFLAGVLLAAGALAQPLLLFVAVFLLLVGEWRPLAAALPSFVLFAGVSASQPLGLTLWSQYLSLVSGTRLPLVSSESDLAVLALKTLAHSVALPFIRSQPTLGQSLRVLFSALLLFGFFLQAGFSLRTTWVNPQEPKSRVGVSPGIFPPNVLLFAQGTLVLLILWPRPEPELFSLALPAAFLTLAGRRLKHSALPLCAVFLALAIPVVGHPAVLWARKAGLLLLLLQLAPEGIWRWQFFAPSCPKRARSLPAPVSRPWRFAVYAVVALLAVAAPPFLEALNPTLGAFQWRGLLASAALLLIATLEVGRRFGTDASGERWVVLGLFFASAFFFLNQQTAMTFKHGDYINYESGAKALTRHENPYIGTGYIYPPLQAQVMEQVFTGINVLVQRRAPGTNPERAWTLLFYLYDSSQFLQLLLAWCLCFSFATLAGLQPAAAAMTTTVLFFSNEPLQSTLTRTQINLWVLNASLLAMVLVARAPAKAGWALALGGHIKIYPLILVGPWAVCRRWAACLWAFVGAGVFLLLETRCGTRWELWRWFLQLFRQFPSGGNNPRSINLDGFISNSFLVPHNLFNAPLEGYVSRAQLLAKALLVAWFIVRFLGREWRTARSALADVELRARLDMLRLQGHCVDALVFILAMAPLVWHHHYVLGMPLVLWAVAHDFREHPARVFLGACLFIGTMYCDVYPLAYVKIAGLCLLLWSTGPTRLASRVQPASPTGALAPEPQ